MGFMTTAAASGVLGFLTKGAGSKLITYGVLIWILAACVNLLTSLLPAMMPKDVFGMLPSYMFYFVNLFMLPAWVAGRAGILVTRWFIRKIPIIGG